MTLTIQNQLTLLHDLLDEQITDKSGSIAEYQQIKRLVQTMISKNYITDGQLLNLLPEIYNYGLRGEIAQCLTEHIVSNEENIEIWKNAILETKLE